MDTQSRQEYVKAAISFLQNPKLIDSPLKEKLKFLRDKGLSELEVDEALNLALSQRHQAQSGKWNFLLILGVCVGGYKLYQAYLEQKAHKNGTNGQEVEADSRKYRLSNFSEVRDGAEFADKNHPTLSEIMQAISELKKLLDQQRSNFKNDIQSLRTLLLGHEKFAAPPKIPEWQMATTAGQDSTPKEIEVSRDPNHPLIAAAKKQKNSGRKVKSANNDNDMPEAVVLSSTGPYSYH